MIDTNVLLDWLLDRDATRTEAIDELFSRAKGLHVPDVIIVELAFVLEKFYELPRDVVASNITKVLDEPILHCNHLLFRRTIAEYVAHPSLSLVDCYLMNYAEAQRILPVWTSDKKLVNQSAGRAKSLGPAKA